MVHDIVFYSNNTGSGSDKLCVRYAAVQTYLCFLNTVGAFDLLFRDVPIYFKPQTFLMPFAPGQDD